MGDDDVQQTILVVGVDGLHLWWRLVDVEFCNHHLGDVGEVQRAIKERNGDRLLIQRTVTCYHTPETNNYSP